MVNGLRWFMAVDAVEGVKTWHVDVGLLVANGRFDAPAYTVCSDSGFDN